MKKHNDRVSVSFVALLRERGRKREPVLNRLPEIPRKLELRVKILEALSEQMKYFLNDVSGKTQIHTDQLTWVK